MLIDYRYLVVLIAIFLLVSCHNKQKENDNSISLEQVIKANSESLGGDHQIDKIDAIKITSIMKEETYHDSVVFVADRLGRMRVDIYDLNSNIRVFSESYDGENGHQRSPKKGQELSSEKGTLALSHTVQFPGHIFQLKDMAQNGHKAELIGKEKIDGIDYHIIKLTLSDGFESYYFVSSKDWLIHKIRSKRALHVDIDPNEQFIEVQHSNYKSVNGVLKPFKVIEVDLKTNKILVETIISKYLINPKINDSLFVNLNKVY
ncbi:MAG: hypothetical protein AB3N14_05625 [Flavobacteriaceae bacterium]